MSGSRRRETNVIVRLAKEMAVSFPGVAYSKFEIEVFRSSGEKR